MNITPVSLMNFNVISGKITKQSSFFGSTNLTPLTKDTVSFKSNRPETSFKLKDAIQKEDYENVLKEFDFEVEKDPDTGKLYVSEYSQPDEDTTFEDYGINEQRLFNSIKQFDGETVMKDSSVVKLGNQIFEFLNIENSKVKDLGSSKIGILALNPEQAAHLNFKNAQIEDLYIIEKDSTCEKLGELIKKAKGDLYYLPSTENTYKLVTEI